MGKVEHDGVSAGSTSCIVNNGGRDNKIANNLCVGWSESVATSVRKRVFLRHLYIKCSFYQDRLGTNITKTQKKTRFLRTVGSLGLRPR